MSDDDDLFDAVWPGPDDHDAPVPGGGDERIASTSMSRLRDRAGRVLAGVLALLLVLPVVAWAVDTIVFSALGEDVADAAPELADAVALVSMRGCDGVNGTGSGFATTVDGRPAVITNRHVVAGAAVVGVRTLRGTSGPDVVEVLLAPGEDVAVLVLDEPLGAELRLGRRPTVGERLRLVGFPGARPVTSTGEVVDDDRTRMVLDLPADPGASGAPLVDTEDRVVAQVVARTPDGDAVAIPIDRVAAAVGDVVPAPPC